MLDVASPSTNSNFSYILPRNTQERLRSNEPLSRATPCEFVGDFIPSHSPFAGDVVRRRRPQSTFYVSVRPWPHSGTPAWVLLFLDPENIKKLGVGAIWSFGIGTGLL